MLSSSSIFVNAILSRLNRKSSNWLPSYFCVFLVPIYTQNCVNFAGNVSPLGAGGDFETQINHGNTKSDRTTRRIVTVKPRLRQTAVSISLLSLYRLFSILYTLFFSNKYNSVTFKLSTAKLYFAQCCPRIQFS